MANHTFYAPVDLGEACGLLADQSIKPLAIAGGTDVMVRFNRNRRTRQETLIYLGQLGLDYIREEDGQLQVGALATLSKIARNPLVGEKAPLLAKAVSEMASPAVRNAATLGGNVVNNARFADGVAALTALGATVVVASTRGDKAMSMEDFSSALRKDKLAHGGIVKHFMVPPLVGNEKWCWDKMRQRKGEARSIVSLAVRAGFDDGKISVIRLVLGCMTANPFVSKTAAEMLNGRTLDQELIEQVAAIVVDECNPVSDARATAWYRTKVTAVMVKRALQELQ